MGAEPERRRGDRGESAAGTEVMERGWIVGGLTALTAAATLLGGTLAIRAGRRLPLLMAFGGGVLLGAVYFDLLPEALAAGAAGGWTVRGVLAIAGAAVVGFYLLERLLVIHACPEGDCGNEAHQAVGRAGALALIGHSTLDGTAIGAATALDWRTGLLVALAVIGHDLSDGLNTVLLVTRGRRARPGDVAFLIADALAPMAGGLLALLVLPSAGALATFLALASGLFLYTSLSDLLPEAHRRWHGLGTAAATVAGVVFIAVAVQLIER